MRLLRREICCLQHGETESNVWNTFVWSCPTWPSRWGMHISIDWPRLKSCQAVCDECTRGEIYSSLSRDAGCLAMWGWRESCVTKIWGSGAWSRIRVISFRYHGFPYSTIGDFLDPNIRVIRGPYCIGLLKHTLSAKASYKCWTLSKLKQILPRVLQYFSLYITEVSVACHIYVIHRNIHAYSQSKTLNDVLGFM